MPRVIQRERDLARRAPYFWLTGLAAAAMIAASGFFFQQATGYADAQTLELQSKVNRLQVFADQIEAQNERLAQIELRSRPYSQAVNDRVYWITTLNELNEKLADDMVWITELQPLANGQKLIAEPMKDGEVAVDFVEVADEGNYQINGLLFRGLWRENDAGANVVYAFVDNLRKSKSPIVFFDLLERDENGQPVLQDGQRVYKQSNSQLFPGVDDPGIVGIDFGTAGDKHAYPFHMVLPLPEGRQIQFTK